MVIQKSGHGIFSVKLGCYLHTIYYLLQVLDNDSINRDDFVTEKRFCEPCLTPINDQLHHSAYSQSMPGSPTILSKENERR